MENISSGFDSLVTRMVIKNKRRTISGVVCSVLQELPLPGTLFTACYNNRPSCWDEDLSSEVRYMEIFPGIGK